MKNLFYQHLVFIALFAVFGMGVRMPAPAYAQAVPSAAQAERVKPRPEPVIPNEIPSPMAAPKDTGAMPAPEGADQTSIRIGKIVIAGATVFSPAEIAGFTKPYEGTTITLDVIWRIAGEITDLYRARGYFLSRAYVPAQELEDGADITINVVEGKIGSIDTGGLLPQSKLIDVYLNVLKNEQPIRIQTLESVLLRLNDLPGIDLRAVLNPAKDGPEGQVGLALRKSEEVEKHFSAEVNNFGSKYLGPYQTMLGYHNDLVPLQNTQIYLSSSLPADELRYASLLQSGQISYKWGWEFEASTVKAAPGFTLKDSDIDSKSQEASAGITYQPIRQRQKNLKFRLELRARNTDTTLRNTDFVEDRVRMLHAVADFDMADSWDGYNYFTAEITQGLSALGASQAGDINLSRAQAKPDFTRLNLSYARQQLLGQNFLLVGQAQGQLADGPLFSSEEFGYGGPIFGRAYDPSEITGDHGIAGGLEVRYLGLGSIADLRITPLGFYDIGKVWNDDPGEKPQSAASAGIGVNIDHSSDTSLKVLLAQPLTRTPAAPLAENADGARLSFSLKSNF